MIFIVDGSPVYDEVEANRFECLPVQQAMHRMDEHLVHIDELIAESADELELERATALKDTVTKYRDSLAVAVDKLKATVVYTRINYRLDYTADVATDYILPYIKVPIYADELHFYVKADGDGTLTPTYESVFFGEDLAPVTYLAENPSVWLNVVKPRSFICNKCGKIGKISYAKDNKAYNEGKPARVTCDNCLIMHEYCKSDIFC